MEMGMKSELSPRSGRKGDWSLAAMFEVGRKMQRTVFTSHGIFPGIEVKSHASGSKLGSFPPSLNP